LSMRREIGRLNFSVQLVNNLRHFLPAPWRASSINDTTFSTCRPWVRREILQLSVTRLVAVLLPWSRAKLTTFFFQPSTQHSFWSVFQPFLRESSAESLPARHKTNLKRFALPYSLQISGSDSWKKYFGSKISTTKVQWNRLYISFSFYTILNYPWNSYR
jgi:hypothetical protein